MRRYFGEDVGLYFAFLQLYTQALRWPGTLGLLVFIVQVAEGQVSPNENSLTPPFAVFLCLWVSAFLSQWKRTEALLKFRWGTEGYEASETERRGFEGESYSIESLDADQAPALLAKVRSHIIVNARIENVGKSQSCMVSKQAA